VVEHSAKFSTRFSTFVFTTALVVGSSLTASAQASQSDHDFVTRMLQLSRAQIAMAQLAERRVPTNVTVMTVSTDEIREWSTIRSKLLSYAYTHGLPGRGELSARQQAMLDQLGRTPPPDFEHVYLRDASDANRTALTLMDSPVSPTLERFIAQERPIVANDGLPRGK
jgi:predicted outer membrane protein